MTSLFASMPAAPHPTVGQLLKVGVSVPAGLSLRGQSQSLSAPCDLSDRASATVRGFPGGSVARKPITAQEMLARSLSRADPLEKGMAAHPSTLAWETSRTGGLAGCGSQGLREADTAEVMERSHTPSRLGKLRVEMEVSELTSQCEIDYAQILCCNLC